MIEALLILVLSFTSGYGTRWYTEPEKVCKTIEVEVPSAYLNPQMFRMCKEGIDPVTGIEEICMMNTPRYVLEEDELETLAKYIKGQRIYLQELIKVIDIYNKDKFILK